MEGRVNAVPVVEVVAGRLTLLICLCIGNKPMVAGTQLSAQLAEEQIPGGQPHLIPWLVCWGCWSDGQLRRCCDSAQHAEDGCELSPTLSFSLGTSSPQLEPPRALPPTGRAGVGNRVRIGRESVRRCLGGESSRCTGPGEEAAPAVLVVMAV